MVILDEIKMVYYQFNQSNTINIPLLNEIIELLLLLRLVIGMYRQSMLQKYPDLSVLTKTKYNKKFNNKYRYIRR